MADTANAIGRASASRTASYEAAAGAAAPSPLLTPALGTTARQARSEGFWRASLRRMLRNKMAMVALVAIAAMMALAFAAPLIANALGMSRDKIDLLQNYQRPSARHWFGTDEYGRDYFIRILYAGQISILSGLGVAAVILVIAIPAGLAAGYFSGLVDDIFNWVVQIFVTTPTLFVLILIAAWIPPTPVSLALIIGAFGWMGNARQSRGLTISLKRADYVLAARALGAGSGRIMYRHLMPNMVSLMLVLAGFDVIRGIFFEV